MLKVFGNTIYTHHVIAIVKSEDEDFLAEIICDNNYCVEECCEYLKEGDVIVFEDGREITITTQNIDDIIGEY